MFNSSIKVTPEFPKIPTFKQYLKSVEPSKIKAVENKLSFLVDVVWLPVRFPNLTFQTYAFRLAISDKDLITEYSEHLAKISSGFSGLGIIIEDFSEETVKFELRPKPKGTWNLTDKGYFFKVS